MSEQPEAPREEAPAACESALVPGVIVCRNPDGSRRPVEHTPPHTGISARTGSRVTWTDEEATTNG